jgi:hypothetical protein
MKRIASWKSLSAGQTLENCRIRQTPSGFLIESVINGVVEDQPTYCAYKIRTDKNWNTLEFLIYTWLGWEEHSITMKKNLSGIWERNGREANSFSECTDIDITLTPFTNTLPIKRMSFEIGETKTITVIYIDIAKQTIEPAMQIYTRLSQNVYRFETASGDFSAEITVDEDGFVTDYPTLFNRL